MRSDWFYALVEAMRGNVIAQGECRIIKPPIRKKTAQSPNVLPESLAFSVSMPP